jgi:hypothetical protein
MRANLAKVRRCLAWLSRMLRSENTSPKVCGVFYKATIQAALLFESKTWNLAPSGMACLECFHLRAAWQMSGTWHQKRPDGTWKYPNSEKVLQDVTKYQPLYWCTEAAHCKFYCQLAYLSVVFGRSEETWVCSSPILVGAAVGH